MHDQVVGGGIAGEPALGVALRVRQGHHQTWPTHRVEAGVGGEDVGPVGDGDQRRVDAGGAAVVVVDLRHHRVAFTSKPVD